MASISWIDDDGLGTLTNGKQAPADKLNAWTPQRKPIGPVATGLGTGRLHRFSFRTDTIAQFQIDAIPGTDANMELMLRLQEHLLNGGIVTLDYGLVPQGSLFATSSLAPETEPQIDFSDRQMLEYSFVVTLRASIAGGSDFYPLLLPNLLLWWMGDTLNGVVEDAGSVPLWPDTSGNENDGDQPSGGRMPTFREAVVNGHSAVEFGAEDYLISPDIVQPTSGTTLFVVLKRTGSFVTHGCFAGFAQSAGSGGTFPNDGGILEQYSGRLSYFDAYPTGDDTDPHYSVIGSPSTSWCVVTLVYTSTSSCTPYYNCTAGTSFNPTADIEGSDFRRFFTGAGNGSGVWYGANCQIAECIWYGATFSEADRDSVHSYLASRYGITLP